MPDSEKTAMLLGWTGDVINARCEGFAGLGNDEMRKSR